MSGMVVATTIRSRQSGRVERGVRIDCVRSLVSPLSAAMRRDRMPERVRIHSSEVSTNFAGDRRWSEDFSGR